MHTVTSCRVIETIMYRSLTKNQSLKNKKLQNMKNISQINDPVSLAGFVK